MSYDEVYNLDHGMDGGDPDYDDEFWENREAYEEADCANCGALYYVHEGKDGICGYCVANGDELPVPDEYAKYPPGMYPHGDRW